MKRLALLLIPVFLVGVLLLSACAPTYAPPPPREDEGVKKQQEMTSDAAELAREAATKYGFTVEVENLLERIIRTNDPARVEWVYFVSPYTGEIIFKATVVGKVTSTTKRLDAPESYELAEVPCTLTNGYCGYVWLVFERVGPDGSYGESTPGIFWFDTAGLMHQVRGIESALIFELERPYTFTDNRVDLTDDIRLQQNLFDQGAYDQALRVREYIQSHPEWRPGELIPLEVMTGQ